MKHCFRRWTGILVTVGLMVVCVSAGPAFGQSRQVLVLPFKMNAPQDMTYLQQGIFDMLASRLTWPGQVSVVPKAEAQRAFLQAGGMTESTAKEIARGLGAQYVLFGTITVIGQGVSIDSQMADMAGVRPPVVLHTETKGLDSVIPRINQFADEINSTVFGRGPGSPGMAQGPVPAPVAPSVGPKPEYNRHPDYLLTGKEGQSLSPLNPNFIAALGGSPDREGNFWRSPTLNANIIGLAIADLDRDGTNEVIYATTNSIVVSRFQNGSLVKLDEYQGNSGERFLTLDALDVNRNGVPELFISNQITNRIGSLVLEIQGGKLAPIVTGSPFFFRVIGTPNGPMLVGQRSGQSTLFYGPVKTLQWSGSDYEPAQTLPLPKQANVFNFSLSSSDDAVQQIIPLINENDRLLIFGADNEELWTSNEHFGGSPYYVEYAQTDQASFDAEDSVARAYIPTRILIADLNDDSKMEIILAQNERATASSVFDRWRKYKRGSIYSLNYRNMSLRENWRSRPLPGPLTDYQIGDFDNNGRLDLVVAVNMEKGEGVAKSRSAIVAYELASSDEMRAEEANRMQ